MVPVIEAWHKDGYTPDDKEAWDNYARIIKINATGYNMFTRFKINAQKAANTWVKLINCQISGIYGNGCNVVIDVVSDESGVLFYGSSKVALYKEVAGVYSSGHSTFTIINLEEFTRYYFFILNTSSGEVARTGIYTFRTTTGGPVGLTGHWDQLNNGYDKAVWGVKIFPTGHWDQIGNGYDRATWGTKIYPTGHWDQVGNGYDRATWG